MSVSSQPFRVKTDAACRCVVVEAGSYQRIQKLVQGLERRGATVVVTADADRALAALDAQATQVLIVSDLGVADRGDFWAKVNQSHPKLQCWRFDAVNDKLVSVQDLKPELPGEAELAMFEAVTAGREDLVDAAKAVLMERSGIPDVVLLSPDAGAPPDYEAVAMADGRRLAAPQPVTAEQLQPWADWLYRWFALEQTLRRLNHLSITDDLTGLGNRRHFDRRLRELIDLGHRERLHVTLLFFDIDDFKRFNDRFGHSAGDEILRAAAELMRSLVRSDDVVARIGGDEFAVIFWDAEQPRRPNSSHPRNVLTAVRRFQEAICDHRFPKLGDDAPATLTISGGLATYPWDGRTAPELFEAASKMAIESKRSGKNVLTLGPGAAALARPPEDQPLL